jgi:tetratricopeptide (TPR) repeat protein
MKFATLIVLATSLIYAVAFALPQMPDTSGSGSAGTSPTSQPASTQEDHVITRLESARRWLDQKENSLRDYDMAVKIVGASHDDEALTFIIANLEKTFTVDTALVYVQHYAEADAHWAVIAALLYLHKDDVNTAVAVMENVLGHPGRLKPEELSVALDVAARVYVVAQEFDKASNIYLQIIQQHPDDMNANNNLASILSEQLTPPDLDQARTYAEKAVQIMRANNRENASVLDTQGYIQGQTGHLDDAIRNFKRALEIQPAPDIWFHLGQVMLKKGDFNEAERCFQNAKDILKDQKTKGQAPNPGLEPNIDDGILQLRKATAHDTGHK